MTAIFESMIKDFIRKDTEQLLEVCMNPDISQVKKVPL